MSKITDWIIEREQQGEIEYNSDKAVYEEFRQIMQGKSDKQITQEHADAVEREHERLINDY